MRRDCVEWTGYRDRDGYGKYGGKLAHRLMYEQAVGPIPEGLEIDHLCRNRACILPSHLEAVTRDENNRRMAAQFTHCSNGHEFTPENTGYKRRNSPKKGTGRYCRT